MKEHDRVVLSSDVQERGLKAGDVGTIVHVHNGEAAFEVEFVALSGRTVTVVTAAAADVRPIREDEIPHARTLVGAR